MATQDSNQAMEKQPQTLSGAVNQSYQLAIQLHERINHITQYSIKMGLMYPEKATEGKANNVDAEPTVLQALQNVNASLSILEGRIIQIENAFYIHSGTEAEEQQNSVAGSAKSIN